MKLNARRKGVYSGVNINDLRPEQQATVIESRLSIVKKKDKIRARIEDKGWDKIKARREDKGYTKQIEDAGTIYASTPIFCILRILLTLAMTAMIHPLRNIKAGDISVEFLQSLAMSKLVQQRQNLAQILQDLNMTRLKSEPSVYMTKDGTACILVHKDDRLSIRRQLSMNCSQQHKVPARQAMPPQERGITNKGDHYEISLSKDYTTTMLEKAGMTTYETATTPGTAANKASNDDNENTPVDKEERALYRIIGKLQRMTHTRPDPSFATQELATTNIHRAEKSEAHTEVRARYVSSPHIGKAIPGSNKAVNNEAWKSNNSRRVVEEEEHKKHYTIRNFLTETIPHEQTTNTHPHGLH